MAQDKMQGYDYTAHDWDIGESITQDKMDNLENAVESDYVIKLIQLRSRV